MHPSSIRNALAYWNAIPEAHRRRPSTSYHRGHDVAAWIACAASGRPLTLACDDIAERVVLGLIAIGGDRAMASLGETLRSWCSDHCQRRRVDRSRRVAPARWSNAPLPATRLAEARRRHGWASATGTGQALLALYDHLGRWIAPGIRRGQIVAAAVANDATRRPELAQFVNDCMRIMAKRAERSERGRNTAPPAAGRYAAAAEMRCRTYSAHVRTACDAVGIHGAGLDDAACRAIASAAGMSQAAPVGWNINLSTCYGRIRPHHADAVRAILATHPAYAADSRLAGWQGARLSRQRRLIGAPAAPRGTGERWEEKDRESYHQARNASARIGEISVNRAGIEIEFCAKTGGARCPVPVGWRLESDSSISPKSGEHAFEAVSRPGSWDAITRTALAWRDMLDARRLAPAAGVVERGCGLHVTSGLPTACVEHGRRWMRVLQDRGLFAKLTGRTTSGALHYANPYGDGKYQAFNVRCHRDGMALVELRAIGCRMKTSDGLSETLAIARLIFELVAHMDGSETFAADGLPERGADEHMHAGDAWAIRAIAAWRARVGIPAATVNDGSV